MIRRLLAWTRRWLGVMARPSAYFSLGFLTLGGFIAGIMFWGGFNTAMELTNREPFCTGCHEMRDNVFAELKPTIHYANRSGVRATCPDCHVPHEWTDKLARKMQASKEVWGHLFGTISTREKFVGKRLELAQHEWARLRRTIRSNAATATTSSRWTSRARASAPRHSTPRRSPGKRRPASIATRASRTGCPRWARRRWQRTNHQPTEFAIVKILLAADGSNLSHIAARHLMNNIAWFSKTPEIHVVHVHPATSYPGASKSAVEVDRREQSETALAVTEKELISAKVAYVSFWKVGNVAQELGKYVKENGIDLVVMGSHGHGALANVALGSVVTQCIASLQVPVMIVRSLPAPSIMTRRDRTYGPSRRKPVVA